MRYDDLQRRLARPPSRLPPPPRAIQPVLLAGAGDWPPAQRWVAAQRDAAVLVLFHAGDDGEAYVVLTQRAAGGHRHAGQVSFPGGAIDAGESVVEAALREAREEVGLVAEEAAVLVVATLPPVEVRVSGFRIHPVLAATARRPRLTADDHEVAAIIHAPVAAFLPGAPIVVQNGERDGLRLRYGAYPVGGHLVWGATAQILGGIGAWLGATAG